MSRAEWLMAQVDLDPIESQGSQELSMSTFKMMTKKRTLQGGAGISGSIRGPDSSQGAKTSFGSNQVPPPLT